MKKFIYLFLIIIFSCEKDDICSDTTQTTPRLIIEFYNNDAPDEILIVPALFAYGLDAEGIPVLINNEIVTDRSSISLPLKTDNTQTDFKLYKSYDIENGIESGNADIISVTYATENVYVSRACGYKTNFEIQTFSITTDSDQWMMSNPEILITKITNENEIHVKVLH